MSFYVYLGGRSPGVRSGNPLQYSHLENALDRGVWWAAVHGVAGTRTQLSTHMDTAHRTSKVEGLQINVSRGKRHRGQNQGGSQIQSF